MTVLGNSDKVRKAGRYARVMGNFWRHAKTEGLSDSACGVLVKVWSYCADQGVDRVAPTAMRKLYGSKNGRRAVLELVEAGLLEATDDGSYAPHDWLEHNPVARPREANERRMRGEREENERKAPSEIVQEMPDSRTRASLHVPCPISDLPTVDQRSRLDESGVFRLEPPPAERAPKQRTPRPKPPHREAFRKALHLAYAARGLLPPSAKTVSAGLLDEGAKRAALHAERAGLTLEAAMAQLAADVALLVDRDKRSPYCIRDWQPGIAEKAPVRPLKPTRAPATTAADFKNARPIEEQLEAMERRFRMEEERAVSIY